jgi:urease accessory protein
MLWPQPVLEEGAGRRLDGHLHLVCDADERGQTRLCRQSFSAPIHLSKPHRDGDTLIVNVANPTAGFFAGDRLTVDVSVERGARLLLTAPGANRVHAMDGDGGAFVRQRFRVAAGGSLETWPELLIPQAGSRFWQQTVIELEEGAELLFFEKLAPGRTAMGEVFAFADLRLDTDLSLDARLLLRERTHLWPGNPGLEALIRRFPTAYYASALLISPGLAPAAACWQKLHEQQDDQTWLGVSAFAKNAFVLKMIAQDSLSLRRALVSARQTIYQELGRKVPDLRRN